MRGVPHDRENWTPAINGKLDRVGGEDRENRGAIDIFGKKGQFPISSETENPHWLNGDKSVITLTTAEHECVHVRFTETHRYS